MFYGLSWLMIQRYVLGVCITTTPLRIELRTPPRIVTYKPPPTWCAGDGPKRLSFDHLRTCYVMAFDENYTNAFRSA